MAYGATGPKESSSQAPVESEDSSDWQPGRVPTSDLPTRLLEIGTETPSSVRLVDLSKASESILNTISSAGYAALSYCWGPGGNPVQLTSATSGPLQQGILSDTLPATIRDIIRLSSLIGIRYLWVDALCIQQDSDHDKQAELAKMAQYYHNNTVTICAASAASASEGLQPQGTRPVHQYGPMQIATAFGGKAGCLLLHSDRLSIAEPTTSRGWTLQESLLSRRILTCSNQLYYCCATANAECAGPYHKLSLQPDRNFSDPKSLVPRIHPASVWRVYPLLTQWEFGVKEFSTRAISFADDKLPAISGFARVMHAKFQAKEGDFTGDPRIQRRYPVQYQGKVLHYLAGLFLSYDDQAVTGWNLLWRAALTGNARVASYRAPTWSWACLDGPIVSFDGSHELEKTVVRLVRHEYEPAARVNPYGSVQHASIHVSAPMRLAVDAAELLPAQWLPWSEEPSGVFAFYPDTAQDLAYLERAVAQGSRDVWLLLVAYNKTTHRHGGLIVSRFKVSDTSDEDTSSVGTFERRGSFTLRFAGYQPSEATEKLMHKAREFFETAAVTVRLV
ncbi:heterokaryon incompatibility protein-domain-containing protein [Microdochium bolleyi]|uniref:Heterokaryon incompatibility protein-domain-containing protein n=1 Tax=Microdochium bolleyi TaxID=196109 RepID=A0A136JDE4_9PEZI|nr:heterokaryon incompatibility protein-domain-containing protein [Microdochium bolleyi]